MLDPQYLFQVELIFALAAFAQGFTGLGFGIIAIAGIAFTPWDLERATVVTNILLMVLSATILYRGRKNANIDWKLVGILLAGATIGIPSGYWFIFNFGDRLIFRSVLGGVLILFALNGLFKPPIRKKLNMAVGISAGFASGFLAGAFTAGGPPAAIFLYSRQKNPVDTICTLQAVFMAAVFWRLCNILFLGKGVSLEILSIAALSLPVIIVFTALGYSLAKRLPGKTFLKIAYGFIGCAGIIHVLKGLGIV